MLKKLPPITRNFYFIVGVSFLIWMVFFDQNDFISQYRMKKKLTDLEEEYAYYAQQMPEVISESQAFKNNSALLEKYAREQYLMKKPTEDLYIIREEDK